MNENREQCKAAPLVHGRMIYRCEQCGRIWPMYLEKGIEEFGENHKPSPFTIACPHCGGWAMDVSGIQKVPGGGYVSLPDGYGYFANLENRDCGVPTFPDGEPEKEVVAELRETLNEQLKRMINAVFAEKAAQEVKKLSGMLARKTGVSVEAAMGMILNILERGGGLLETLEELNGLFDGCPKPPPKVGEFLVVRTVWDRIEEWEKRRTFERETVSRFRQYKSRESAWSARKNTGPRQREWRGPWKEN